MELFGRREIFTDYDYISDENVVEVLNAAMKDHAFNSNQIDYLYNYYKGNQPILHKTKEFRPEINNKVVENRAYEITSFKVGYLVGNPIQYVGKKNDDSAAESIRQLNEYLFAEDKHTKDTELVEWFTICGLAYRLVLPDVNGEEDESPIEIFTLDPRYTFVVKRSGFDGRPMLGVNYFKKQDGTTVFNVYSKNRYWRIENTGSMVVTMSVPHIYGDIPIIEYKSDMARLGAFEIVVPMLNALSELSSNRLDSISQFVQAILFLKGFQIEAEQLKKLQEYNGLMAPSGDSDAKYLTAELNQMQTQSLVDYMEETILIICAMPNRNGGSSTSDTGTAVYYRDGFSAAEVYAERTEGYFKQSEKKFLKIALNMMNTLRNTDISVSDIDIVFTRRNYANDQTRISNLLQLLSSDKIHPRLAWQISGVVPDPENAYKVSMEYYDSQQTKLLESLNEEPNTDEPITDDEENNEE